MDTLTEERPRGNSYVAAALRSVGVVFHTARSTAT
jgi:hypothetical protein